MNIYALNLDKGGAYISAGSLLDALRKALETYSVEIAASKTFRLELYEGVL